MDEYPDGIHPGFEGIDRKHQRASYQVLEDFWQFSKIFNIDLDKEGYVTTKFFERRAKGFADPKGHRRAIPKAKGYPVSSYFNGKLYGYLESRIFYCQEYVKMVKRTREWQELRKLVREGQNIQILGFDGQDLEITEETMGKAYADPSKPFGHELVLCCMLKKINVWE